MKFLIIGCTIFVLSLINSSKADCSDNSWKSVKDIDVEKILGRWYAVIRFANGENDNSVCLVQDLTIHPTIPNAIKDAAKRTFENGRKKAIYGAITLADPSKTNATLHVSYTKGASIDKYITAIKYDEFAIVRACFNNEEHFWAYSRLKWPPNSTFVKIDKEIDDQGINIPKLINTCMDD